MPIGAQNPILLAVQQVFPNRAPHEHRIVRDNIEAAYSQPPRHYHTVKHLNEMLEHMSRHVVLNKQAFLAALLFHDVVYEPHRSAPGYVGLSNEQESALLCKQILHIGGVDEATMARAKELILMTETHKAPDDDEEALLFMDIDMAIVGAPERRYREYAGQNAREYLSAFTPEQYLMGRTAFLTRVQESKTPVFKTKHFASREKQADENIAWELKHLVEIVAAAAMTNHVAEYKYDWT